MNKATLNEKVNTLLNAGLEFIAISHDRLADGVSFNDVWYMLSGFIKLAEDIVDFPKSGADKSMAVMMLWLRLDETYGVVDGLAKHIPDKIKIRVWFIKVSIPIFPKKAINKIIEKVVVPAMVSIANKLGWGK